MIAQHNPYFVVFKTARERLIERENVAQHLRTIDLPNLDQRRYNRPKAPEIAVLMVGAGEESISGEFDIVIQNWDEPLHRILQLHNSYCPLRYSILFIYNEQGLHLNMSHLRKYFIHEIALMDNRR